jgi:hypothetical protein
MSFAGAPRVLYVKPGGLGTNDGTSWATAVGSFVAAMSKITANGWSGQVLILVAPGEYTHGDASATVSYPDVRIQGAGSGTVLRVGNAGYNPEWVLNCTASNIELADLTIINQGTNGSGKGVYSGTSATENLRITRCNIEARTAVVAYKRKGIIIQESRLEGTPGALAIGNQSNSETELFSCLAFNSDFRVVNTTDDDSNAIVVNGGELTAMNCNVTALAKAATTTKKFVGGSVINGGQIVVTNCEVTVDATGTAGTGSKSYGFEVDASSRLKLTACSVLAQRAASNKSIDPGLVTNRIQADVSLLQPSP